MNVTGFYTFLFDSFVRSNTVLEGKDSIFYEGVLSQVQTLDNLADTEVYGIQTSVKIQPYKRLKITSTFNFQVGRDDFGDEIVTPSRHSNPWYGTTKVHYTKEKLSLVAYAAYSGKKRFDDLAPGERTKLELYAIDKNGNPYSPSWLTFNIKANYRFAEHWGISGGLENITDRRYRTFSSGLSAPGRNFILSLKASF